MATKPKAILSTHDGREASPITKASNVLFENGQTAQDILNDRQDTMISPVIENSSSMFKVGQGDNVDYSSNVVNGAYEGMVLKGKTMVNCIQESSSQDVVLPYEFEEGRYVTINDTKESGALGVELKGQTLVNLVPKMNNSGNESSLVYITEDKIKISEDSTAHRQGYWTSNEVLSKFKTNTTYTVIANITENTLTSDFILINAYAAVGGDIASTMLRVPVNFTGRFVGVFETVSDFTGRTRLGFNAVSGSEGKLTMKNDMVILEGDWTNQELPFDSFFTGMASCKMPILHTVGKNLFNHVPESLIGKTSYGMNVSISNGKIKITGTPTGTYGYVEIVNCVEKGKQYTFSAYENGQLATSGYRLWVRYSDGTLSNPTSGGTFVAKNLDIVRVEFVFEGFTVGTAVNKEVNIQIEESSSVTSYESYKSSILSLPEEVVLRSLPKGVCDTFNTRTGVYTQRIEEVVLNGIENWTMYALNENFPDVVGFYYTHRGGKSSGGTIKQNYIGNLPVFTEEKFPGNLSVNTEGVGLSDGRYVKISILKSKLSSVDVAGLKAWLQLNPMTVQYELATPVITKFNLSSTLKSWNTTTHIYSEIPENSLYPILSHSNPTYPVILKPSTKYSIVANAYSNYHTNSAINFNLGGATASTVVGNRVTTVTTPSTLSNELLTMSGRGNKLSHVMVIEGDVVGDEPYFEGICDCKSPILLNVGKNLFDVDDLIKKHSHPSVVEITKTHSGFNMKSKYTGVWHATNYSMQLKPNTQYIFNCIANTKSNTGSIKLWNDCESFHVYRDAFLQNTTNLEINITFTTQKDGVVKFQLNTTRDISALGDIEVLNVSLYELANQTTYEPYKSNTTTFEQKDDKTIVLRSLPNGVCDTLNVETGEYVQRIGETTYNDEMSWYYYPDNEVQETVLFSCTSHKVGIIDNNMDFNLNCDKSVPTNVWNKEMVGCYKQNGALFFRVKKNLLETVDDLGFKQYLQQNPITVQYELATPITTTIDLQGSPYAYKDGHIQLTSGSIEQSLTPIIEYSLPTNRNGQIRSNQKMVEKHQKELDKLQAIILANLVNSQYNQTLTTLNYELSRV